jgi:putative membrane protein
MTACHPHDMKTRSTLMVVASLLFALPAALRAAPNSAAAPPNDAQIAMIAVVADQVDIDAGNLAAKKASDPKVKEFGELMVRDHTSVNQQASALAKKLNLTPEASPTSKALQDGGKENLAKLEKLSGSAFDKAYVEHEVAYHEQVLDALDKTLIPNAKNAELKQLLESARPVFVSHLEHAKNLQSSLH